jgi:OmpA-OmpF porin, OOP family
LIQFFEEIAVKKSNIQRLAWRALGHKIGQTVLSGLVLIGASQVALAQAAPPVITIETFGESFATALAAPTEQTRVFVYRSHTTNTQQPVNIYLNGQYHASLLSGGYTEFCTAPGDVNIKAALDDAARLHVSKLEAGQRMSNKAGQTVFLKVDERTPPALSLLQGNEAQAKTELKGTRRQIHTISRAKVALTCAEPSVVLAAMPATPALQPTPPTTPAPREYALEADALFEFGKAELRASGFNAIESLVQRVRQDYTSVERIRVVGYTDPIGSAAFNKKLSQARADVVARQIGSRNIKTTRSIQAEGRGAIELAKTSCGNTPTPKNKACHAPNRRVMVVITGARR